ncbi:AAA ATPase, partial [Massospora cicadina]
YPRANKPAASKDTSNAVKKQRVKRGGAKAIHEDDNKDSFQKQLDRGSTNIFTNGDSKSSSSLAELQDDGLAGRDEEKNRLQEFWEKHVLGKHPGSLYISGQPGTGKTALLKEFMAKYHPKRGNAGKGAIHVVHFNCVAVTGPKAFLPALLEAIPTKSNASSEPLERLKHLVTTAPGFL